MNSPSCSQCEHYTSTSKKCDHINSIDMDMDGNVVLGAAYDNRRFYGFCQPQAVFFKQKGE